MASSEWLPVKLDRKGRMEMEPGSGQMPRPLTLPPLVVTQRAGYLCSSPDRFVSFNFHRMDFPNHQIFTRIFSTLAHTLG
jgi:hypothetical protein